MAKPRIRMKPSMDAEGMPRAGASVAQGIWPYTPAHHGASMRTKDLQTWFPRAGSPDADILPELSILRARARDIDRNNGVAHAGIQTILDNVIGSGLRLIPRPDYKALGQSKEWADEWSATVRSLWQQWAWTTACDASDALTWDQQSVQALRAELINGDALATVMWIPGRDDFSTKIMTVESDRLSNPNFTIDTPTLRGGIALGLYGEPLGYHIRNAHPGDQTSMGMYSPFPAWEYVPRRTPAGRLRVLHAFDPERSGQNRGKPILSSVLSQFKNVDRYTAAELQAAVVNAMVAGVIETPMAADDVVALFQNDASEYLKNRDSRAVGLESGSIMSLFPGDKFSSFLPQRPAAQFGVFVENIMRFIGVALDIPYELLLKDFSKSNYSSARAAMLEAWRSFNRRRDWFGTQWGDPTYWLFLEEIVNANKVNAPDFYAKRAAYQRCKWLGPGRGAVDALKEAMAAQIRIDSGVSTLEKECAEQGEDWEEIMEQRATELARAKELNIPQIVSGRATIVPEDTSSVPGVGTPPAQNTPGSAPGAPAASGDAVAYEYRKAAPA